MTEGESKVGHANNRMNDGGSNGPQRRKRTVCVNGVKEKAKSPIKEQTKKRKAEEKRQVPESRRHRRIPGSFFLTTWTNYDLSVCI